MKKALIIQNKYIGDVLTSSLIAENLKKVVGEVEVHFFCYKPTVDVLENNPYIDKVISFEESGIKRITNLNNLARRIKNERYDIVLDPYSKLESQFITLMSGAPHRISYSQPFFKHIYTDIVARKRLPTSETSCTSIDNRISLMEPLMTEKRRRLAVRPRIYLTEEEKEEGRKILNDAGVDFSKKIIMIDLAGSSENDSWPVENMIRLIGHINKYYDFNILFNYKESTQKMIADIEEAVGPKGNVISRVEAHNPREFMKILSQCDALVAYEGSSINMSKALDVATFSIYSPYRFPEDWGCFEDGEKHVGVHFQDLDRRIVNKTSVNKLYKNTNRYYRKLSYSYVRTEVDKFFQGNFGRVDLPREFEQTIPKISVLLITYNEERNIRKFLDEAWYADEIIIVDSNSSDRTAEIAKKHPKVTFITRKFDNFTAQKNFAIEQAKNEWITFFDADERIPKALVYEMMDEIRKEEADAFYVYRRFYFMDKHIEHSGWQNDKAIRLFRKSKNRYSKKRLVHELIETDGKVKILHNRLDHFSYYSIEEYDRKLTQYAILRAREFFIEGLKPNNFHYWVKPWFRFVHHYIFRLGILDGKEGYIISKLHAHSVFKRYLFLSKMWEKENRKKQKEKEKAKRKNK